MHHYNKLKLFLLTLVVITLIGCTTGDKYNNLIVTDGKRVFILKHNIGDNYFLDTLQNATFNNLKLKGIQIIKVKVIRDTTILLDNETKTISN